MVVRHNKFNKENKQLLKKTLNNKISKTKEPIKSESAAIKKTTKLQSALKSVDKKSTTSKVNKPIKNKVLQSLQTKSESSKNKPTSRKAKQVKSFDRNKASNLTMSTSLNTKPKSNSKVKHLKSKDLLKGTPGISERSLQTYSRSDIDFFVEYVSLCEKFNEDKLQSLELMNLREFTIKVFTEQPKYLKAFINNIKDTLTMISQENKASTKEIFNTLRETIRHPESFKVANPKDPLQKLQNSIVKNITS